MIGLMIPKVLGTVVELAASVAVDSAIKVATPTNVKAFQGFLIKGGALLLSGLVATKLSELTVKNAEAVVETLNKIPDEIEVAPSDLDDTAL